MTSGLKAGDLRRAVSEWILPPAVKRVLARTMMRQGSQAIQPAERAVLAANARLQGAYTGRRCLVLGNGPSLASVDIDSLGGEVTIVMNAYNQNPAMRLWQPVVHCAAEPASSYASPDRLRFLEGIVSGYTSTIHVFPIEMKVVFDRTGILPPERLVFVKQDGRKAAEFDRIDLTGPVPSAHDTSILAVSVAIAMGCDPIVLLGLDYDWLSHRSINKHFYDDAQIWWPAEDMAETPYLEVMRQSMPSWEAHAALRRIAANSGQTIVNATEGSFLDVYPTATLGEILARS
jgi:hypothetical protein